jgi:hypothetical protein
MVLLLPEQMGNLEVINTQFLPPTVETPLSMVLLPLVVVLVDLHIGVIPQVVAAAMVEVVAVRLDTDQLTEPVQVLELQAKEIQVVMPVVLTIQVVEVEPVQPVQEVLIYRMVVLESSTLPLVHFIGLAAAAVAHITTQITGEVTVAPVLSL